MFHDHKHEEQAKKRVNKDTTKDTKEANLKQRKKLTAGSNNFLNILKLKMNRFTWFYIYIGSRENHSSIN